MADLMQEPPVGGKARDDEGDLWQRQIRDRDRWYPTPAADDPAYDEGFTWPDLDAQFGPLTVVSADGCEAEAQDADGQQVRCIRPASHNGYHWYNDRRPGRALPEAGGSDA
jgi:hypothetical protein